MDIFSQSFAGTNPLFQAVSDNGQLHKQLESTSDYDETPVSSRGTKQSESEIQKYINMVSNLIPAYSVTPYLKPLINNRGHQSGWPFRVIHGVFYLGNPFCSLRCQQGSGNSREDLQALRNLYFNFVVQRLNKIIYEIVYFLGLGESKFWIGEWTSILSCSC